MPSVHDTTMVELVKNEWFTRVWTFQELCLAQRPIVIYEHATITWDVLHRCLVHHQNSGIALWPSWYRSAWMRDMFLESQHRGNIQKEAANPRGPQIALGGPLDPTDETRIRLSRLATSVLHLSRQRLARDPLDKVYGLYQVFSDLGLELPEPDYRQSPAAVYEEITFKLIQYTRSLSILLDYVISQKRMDGLPSWVPDYSELPWPVHNDLYSQTWRFFFGRILLERRPGELLIQGKTHGTIEAVGDRMPHKQMTETSFEDDEGGYLITLYRWHKFFIQRNAPHTNSNEDMTSFYKNLLRADLGKDTTSTIETTQGFLPRFMLILATVFENGMDDHYAHQDRGDKRSLEIFELVLQANHLSEEPLETDQLFKMISLLQSRLEGMCLFTTSNGLLGLSTGDVQANDTVGLFTGAATPLILRSTQKADNVFRLVGPASISTLSEDAWTSVYKHEDLQTLVLV